MRQLLSGLAITFALIVLFSTINLPGYNTPQQGSGTQHKGNSGLTLPGDGEQMAELNFVTDNKVGDKKTPTDEKISTVQKESEEISEELKEEHNKVDGLIIAFWHGVAAVLIGGAGALVVAWAWMKIRGGK